MPDATPLLVAADQDDESHIVAALCSLNVPAVRSESHLPVDYVWTIDGRPYMGDNKTPQDLIASAEDGRLFQQVWDMQQAGCVEMFILIEGEWSFDNGYNVGNPKHPWSWEEFDALCQSLYERCGVTIIHSARKERTPFRLKALYKRSYEEKGDVASWQLPVKAKPPSDLKRTPPIILADRGYRAQIGAIITLFDGCGVPTADAMRNRFTFMEILGITEEGIERARGLWRSMPNVGDKKVHTWEERLRG